MILSEFLISDSSVPIRLSAERIIFGPHVMQALKQRGCFRIARPVTERPALLRTA
eukprot:SAG11_NODE_13073_length_671_cov_1.627622_2_plen_54_part_01